MSKVLSQLIRIELCLIELSFVWTPPLSLSLQSTESTLDDEDLNSLRQLEQKITMLCLLQGEGAAMIVQAAHGVLYHLSRLQFQGIFNKIILR